MKTRNGNPRLYFTLDHCPKDAARRYRQRVGGECVVKPDEDHPEKYLVAMEDKEDEQGTLR